MRADHRSRVRAKTQKVGADAEAASRSSVMSDLSSIGRLSIADGASLLSRTSSRSSRSQRASKISFTHPASPTSFTEPPSSPETAYSRASESDSYFAGSGSSASSVMDRRASSSSATTGRLPPFPSTRTELVALHAYAGTIRRYEPSSHTPSILKRLSGVPSDNWKTRRIAVAVLAGDAALHLYADGDGRELDRLRLTPRSIVHVPERANGGGQFVLRVVGLPPGHWDGEKEWLLSINTSQELSVWLKTVKDILAALRDGTSLPSPTQTLAPPSPLPRKPAPADLFEHPALEDDFVHPYAAPSLRRQGSTRSSSHTTLSSRGSVRSRQPRTGAAPSVALPPTPPEQ